MKSNKVYETWAKLDSIIKKDAKYLDAKIFRIICLNLECKKRIYLSNNINNEKSIIFEFEKGEIENYKPMLVEGLNIVVRDIKMIDANKKYLEIKKANDNLEEAFIAVTVSLFDSISKDEDNRIFLIEKIIIQYKNFFQGIGKAINEKYEQGYYSELMSLKKMIESKSDDVIVNWVGPERYKYDFLFDNVAIEIKSTQKAGLKEITISNEEQLDKGNIEKLYLVYNRISCVTTGKTVIELAKEILGMIRNEYNKKIYLSKLYLCGIDIYNTECLNRYIIEETNIYLIDDDFPKIKKSDLDPRIHDVIYKINLNDISTVGELKI